MIKPATIRTHCALRLGDNLAHLHFIRKMAQAHPEIHFVHAAQISYLPQLVEVVCDLQNITLQDLAHHRPSGSLDSWKNAGKFWERHELKNDYAMFMLAWFRNLAAQMGLASPLEKPADLLFDYPAIKGVAAEPFDFLIINSEPLSGQWPSMDLAALDQLAVDLSQRHKVITTRAIKPFIPSTMASRLSITGIGGISRFCRQIIMVSTGSSWATFNVWNRTTPRIVFLEWEKLGLTTNTITTPSVDAARVILKEQGELS